MNKRKMIGYMLIFICFMIVSVGSLFAWFTHAKVSNQISGGSSGVNFSYTLHKEEQILDDFLINDLVFFDEENSEELDYFLEMSTIIKLTITSKSDIVINYDIDYSTNKDNDAYVKCLFSESMITNDALKNNADIENIEDVYGNNILSTKLSGTISPKQSLVAYVYIYGIQTNKLASNDFLDENYSFELIISSKS